MTKSLSAMSTSTNRMSTRDGNPVGRSIESRSQKSREANPTTNGSLALAAAPRDHSPVDIMKPSAGPYPQAEFQTHQRARLPQRLLDTLRSVVRWSAAAALTTALAPVFAGIGTAILVFDGRPLFYRQFRVGKNGRLFRIWKFRTMRPNAESTTGPVWCQQEDQRVTMIGRILRASHLDELPQLFNVLAGEMNIVGPRPERPEFVQQLAQDIPGYIRRLQVHPGITGLAQIRQGYDTCLADVRRKVALDRFYIRHASLTFDAYLILGTIPFVVRELLDRVRRKFTRDHEESPSPVLRLVNEVSHASPDQCPTHGITPADIERAIHHPQEARELEDANELGGNPAAIAPPHGAFVTRRLSQTHTTGRTTPAALSYPHALSEGFTSAPPTDDPRSA